MHVLAVKFHTNITNNYFRKLIFFGLSYKICCIQAFLLNAPNSDWALLCHFFCMYGARWRGCQALQWNGTDKALSSTAILCLQVVCLSSSLHGPREGLMLCRISATMMVLGHSMTCEASHWISGTSFFFYLHLSSAMRAYGVPWSISLSTHKLHTLLDVRGRMRGLVSTIYNFLLESSYTPLAIHQVWTSLFTWWWHLLVNCLGQFRRNLEKPLP